MNCTGTAKGAPTWTLHRWTCSARTRCSWTSACRTASSFACECRLFPEDRLDGRCNHSTACLCSRLRILQLCALKKWQQECRVALVHTRLREVLPSIICTHTGRAHERSTHILLSTVTQAPGRCSSVHMSVRACLHHLFTNCLLTCRAWTLWTNVWGVCGSAAASDSMWFKRGRKCETCGL